MLLEPSEHNKYSTVYLKHPVTFDVNILLTYVVFMFLWFLMTWFPSACIQVVAGEFNLESLEAADQRPEKLSRQHLYCRFISWAH